MYQVKKLSSVEFVSLTVYFEDLQFLVDDAARLILPLYSAERIRSSLRLIKMVSVSQTV